MLWAAFKILNQAHFNIHVLRAARLHVEVHYLRTQARLHLCVHLVARLHQLLCQLHVLAGQAVVRPQGQRARQEAH